MCTALENADDATAASLREAYVAADATTAEGAEAVATVRRIYEDLEVERAYLVCFCLFSAHRPHELSA